MELRRVVKKLFIALIVLLLILAGAAWWLLSYIAPDKTLDLQYNPIDVKQKALEMAKQLKPELVLTESEVNDLIKKHLNPNIAEDVRLDGAEFKLEDNRLLADLNITYRDRIPVQVQAEYVWEWEEPNLVLRPQALMVKGFGLPLSLLSTVVVPLEMPAGDVIAVKDVEFANNRIKVLFKLSLQFFKDQEKSLME